MRGEKALQLGMVYMRRDRKVGAGGTAVIGGGGDETAEMRAVRRAGFALACRQHRLLQITLTSLIGKSR